MIDFTLYATIYWLVKVNHKFLFVSLTASVDYYCWRKLLGEWLKAKGIDPALMIHQIRLWIKSISIEIISTNCHVHVASFTHWEQLMEKSLPQQLLYSKSFACDRNRKFALSSYSREKFVCVSESTEFAIVLRNDLFVMINFRLNTGETWKCE